MCQRTAAGGAAPPVGLSAELGAVGLPPGGAPCSCPSGPATRLWSPLQLLRNLIEAITDAFRGPELIIYITYTQNYTLYPELSDKL